MDHFIYDIIRIGDIAEHPGAGRADIGAGRQFLALGKSGIPAEITLVNGMRLFIEISGLIGAGQDTHLTTDAFLAVHHYDAGGFVLIGRLGRTGPGTGWLIAMVAEDWNKFPLSTNGVGHSLA